MKLLIIFVCALALVAQCKAAPSHDQGGDHPEEVAVADAGQEAGSEGPQGSEEAPAVDEPNDGEPHGPAPAVDRNFIAPDSIYIPILTRACTNSACLYICNLLGFANGVCVSTTTCQCY